VNPNSAIAHERYTDFLEIRLRFDEAMTEAQRAQELDPLSPEIVAGVGSVYVFTRRYDEAIA
jgi:Flp pilus assembly protein TadD